MDNCSVNPVFGGMVPAGQEVPAKVLCVGIACVDFVNIVKDYPIEDSDEKGESHYWQRGGNASNTVTVLSLLSVPCELMTVLPTLGLEAKWMRDDLTASAIDVSHCAEKPCQCAISTCIVSSSSSSRTIIHHPRDHPRLTHSDFRKSFRGNFEGYCWMHFELAVNLSDFEFMLDDVVKYNSKLAQDQPSNPVQDESNSHNDVKDESNSHTLTQNEASSPTLSQDQPSNPVQDESNSHNHVKDESNPHTLTQNEASSLTLSQDQPNSDSHVKDKSSSQKTSQEEPRPHKRVIVSIEAEKPEITDAEYVLDRADCVFVSKDMAKSRHCDTPEEALDYFYEFCKESSILVCPWGDLGSMARWNEVKVTAPALKLETAVDTLGAGDTFNAGFIRQAQKLKLFSLTDKETIQDVLEKVLIFANTLAGRKCEVQGYKGLSRFAKH